MYIRHFDIFSARVRRATPHDQQELPPRSARERPTAAARSAREHARAPRRRVEGDEGRKLEGLLQLRHQRKDERKGTVFSLVTCTVISRASATCES